MPNDPASERFFERLPPQRDFFGLTRLSSYSPLPRDWHLAIADVRDSTRALGSGRYQQVSLLSAAVIAAVVNAVRPLSIPYSFGGDGASLCFPGSLLDPVCSALAAARLRGAERFGLDLRTGVIPMADLGARGQEVLVARFQPSPGLAQALFLGNGMPWAEACLKDPVCGQPYRAAAEGAAPCASFQGLECRWDRFTSPAGECMALLVEPRDPEPRASAGTFGAVLSQIQAIYGEPTPNPVFAGALRLSRSPRVLSVEARLRADRPGALGRLAYVSRIWASSRIGTVLMAGGVRTAATDWSAYRPDFVRSSDYRRCDGLLRLLVPGAPAQHDGMEAFLRERAQAGELRFGAHRAEELIATCLVESYQERHQHFIDTADGGFTQAASALKRALWSADARDPAAEP